MSSGHRVPKLRSSNGQDVPSIRAELVGSDQRSALGIIIKSSAPALELCRRLVAAGHDPDQRLDVYRGNVLALRIRSIGEAAGLETNTKGTGFVGHRAVRTAPPMRFQPDQVQMTPGTVAAVGGVAP
jgi:hypothetical protein